MAPVTPAERAEACSPYEQGMSKQEVAELGSSCPSLLRTYVG